MTKKTDPKTPNAAADTREDRLKAALKANLARRKAQTRARAGVKGAQTGNPVATGSEKDA
ncbi:hypothetical protein [uncultured Roseobacter sp.]|uniref:hypothetical protein n=1 Tax=uncultured Roseobacter sp. TaxID=114847 RepID=UPI00260714F9|nr:hypothetical protein [uncultured Roseobacter sp.]